MENFRNKQSTSFKLHANLSHGIKSHTITLCPTWDKIRPSVQDRWVPDPPVSYLVARWGMTGLVFKAPLFYFIVDPKYKSRDAGDSGTTKRP